MNRRQLARVSAWNICYSMQDRDKFLDSTVRGNESWFLQYDPETKHESAAETSIISLNKQVTPYPVLAR